MGQMRKMDYAVENADDVVQYFLAKQSLTQKQIHKLLFFAYQEYLKNNNTDANNLRKALFKNEFEAWIHGPVHTGIYEKYAKNSYGLIFSMDDADKIGKQFKPEVREFLDNIITKYGKFDGGILEAISHNNIAWLRARGETPSFEISTEAINDKDIYESERYA